MSTRQRSPHHTLGQKTYELLLESLLTGKYAPGQRLAYEAVSRDLGVSLTPLKEAFLRLEEHGLLVSFARRGTYVREFLNEDIEELYEIREMMEGLSARLACRNTTEKAIKELRKLNSRLGAYIASGDIKNSTSVDIKFHEHVAKLSGNARLLRLLQNSLLTNLYCISQRGETFLEHGAQTLQQHDRIIDCIERGDEDDAEAAMREQIRKGAEWLLLSKD